MDRYASDEFMLSAGEDAMRLRSWTEGMLSNEVEFQGKKFKMIDIGGFQRQRKHWIYSFDEASLVVYVVGMSDFDLQLLDDEMSSRMHDSFATFQELMYCLNSSKTPVLLVFSKLDRLEKKLRSVYISDFFPEFQGDNNSAQEVVQFFNQMFQDRSGRQHGVPHLSISALNPNAILQLLSKITDILEQ
eukprot:TRINITY_DN8927_c0_g1_i2.p1 TRINITY_DN8927_c0_g1~~TRINITY_DN8927_c0_g1_i2.p1  ORF type:complete len:188 (-),score=46.45 TRINITY_DN8927_c0_g1_i2:237-800(-)